MRAFGLRQGGGGVGVEIGVEEGGVFRKDEMQVVGRVQGDLEGFRTNFQDMAAVLAVCTEEVQVVSRHIDRAGIGRREKADERAGKIFKMEFRLVRGGVDETRSRHRFAGHANMDEIENALDADGGEEIFRRAHRGQARAEVLPTLDILDVLLEIGTESGGHPKGSGRGIWNLGQCAVGTGAVAKAIEQDALAVQTHESAKPEVSMLPHIADGGGCLVNALHERSGGGDLENRVPLHIERLAEAGSDGLVDRFARAFHSRSQGAPDACGNLAVQ